MQPNANFPGIRRPSTDFASIQTRLQTLPLYFDVDLSSARSLATASALLLPIAGNSIYIDQLASTGTATLHFQDDTGHGNTPIGVQAGFIAKIPFTFIAVENDAQPGKIMRIIYGVDIEFTPGVNAQVAISGSVSSVNAALTKTVGAITVTNAAQDFSPANASRKYLFIQNNDTSGDVWVNETGTAVIGQCVKIVPGGYYEPLNPAAGAISIIGSIASNANVVLIEG